MYPLLFLHVDLSSVWCVLAIWWTGPKVFALHWMHSCLVSPDGATLLTCGSLKGTQRDCFDCVCVLCVHRLAVCVSVGVGHVHTVAMWEVGAQHLSMVSRPSLGHNGPARLCVAIAAVGPTLVTPDGLGGLGG